MPDIDAFLDAPVPPVNPDDLSRLWNFMREARAAWEKIHPDKVPSHGLSFDQSIIAEASGSSANPLALWFRTCLIEIMCRQDLLRPWLEADQPSESVFRLAATWPLPNIEQFNPQEFIDCLRAP